MGTKIDPNLLEITRSVKNCIFKTPAMEATEDYGTWKVKAVRLYHQRAVHVAWTPLYYLIDYTGREWGGYDRLESFVRWASRFIQESRAGVLP